MWFIYLVNGFQSKILSDLTAYALSDFGEHSLIPLIGVVASVMTAAVYIPLAKILDIWGRAEGFLLMVTFATIGMGAMAGSHNVATYCAAQVSTNKTTCNKYLTLKTPRSSTTLAGLVSSTPSTS